MNIDERFSSAKDVNTPWSLRRYKTLGEWEIRAAEIRQHIMVCTGLWPLPQKTALKPRIFGRIEREGYSVEKVFFESMPGFFVCGNLYRPKIAGPHPAIACPHGHWTGGRLENSASNSIPGRCINFARQGSVACSYDMTGYNDSDQLAHRSYGGRREDLWAVGQLSLQLWNSIRVMDFLEELPDVDAVRIGCSGASGGGTQAFLLMAIDQRVKAAAPVNMVSAHMQGGCRCENQGHLRLDINNVEIASCMAPRPLLMISCTGDWTKNTPEVEYPAVRDVYALYGAQDQISQVQIIADHNYNQLSREAAYAFFNRHLLGRRGKVAEKSFVVEIDQDLLVFSGRKKPAYALAEGDIAKAVAARSEKRLKGQFKRRDWRRWQAETRSALASLLGVDTAPVLEVKSGGYRRGKDFIAEELVLRSGGTAVRAVLLLPVAVSGKIPAVLLANDGGGRDYDWDNGRPAELPRVFYRAGIAVLIVAPFLTDGTTRDGHDENQGHYHTYNQALMACRVQDVLSAWTYLQDHPRISVSHIWGRGQAGIWSLFARGLAEGRGSIAVDWAHLDLGGDEGWLGDLFVPGIRTLGDVRTAQALCAPGRLLIYKGGRRFDHRVARHAYRTAGSLGNLRIEQKDIGRQAIAEWIADSK